MKTISTFLLATTLHAASYLTPIGIWPICQNSPAVSFCSGYQPGSEQYAVLLSAEHASTIAYRYTVTATVHRPGAESQSIKVIGWSLATEQPVLTLGGWLSDIKLEVQELSASN